MDNEVFKHAVGTSVTLSKTKNFVALAKAAKLLLEIEHEASPEWAC